MKRVSVAIALCLISLFIGAALPPSLSSASSSNCTPSNTMGITLFGGSPPGLNPVSGAISQSAYFIQQLEFKSLSPVATETGTPDLSTSATDWISHNSNYTQWIFNIQPGLKWSNGQPVNASDILATFSSRFAFNSSYDYLGLGQYVKSEFALNSSAVEFNLNQSYAHWPEAIGGTDGYSWLYPASMADQGAGSLFNGTNIADGPFYVSNFVPGQTQMVLLRNPYYEPLPEVCQINVNFVESLSQTATYLLAGTSDLAPVAPATAVSLLQHNNLHVMHPPASLMVTMEYNVTTYPYNMTAFRQALAYGINESQILQRAFYGFGQTAYTSQGMVPTTSSLYNPNQVKYDYSMSNATALLNSINIVKGSDGYLHYPNGTLATLTIWTDSEQSPDPVAANIVATNLQALGFKVNLQVTTKSNIFGDFGSNAQNIEHDLVIWDMAGPEFGDAWIDAQPAWSTYWTAGVPNSHWEYPPSPDAQYQGNLSIVDSTASNTLLQQSLNNIQSLNAKYLPTLVLTYGQNLYAYSTSKFTNWPLSLKQGNDVNQSAFANLVPVFSQTSSISQTSSTSVGPSSSTSAQSILTTSSSSSSSPISSSGSSNYALLVAVAAIVVIVGVAAALLLRRRPGKG